MSLQALGCIIKELFGSIATLFHNAPRCSYAIFNCIGNHRCHTRSLARRFGDVLTGSFQHCLRHYSLLSKFDVDSIGFRWLAPLCRSDTEWPIQSSTLLAWLSNLRRLL